MKNIEIIKMFTKVIEDSFDEKNKIKNIDDNYDIYIKLKDLTELFQERYILDWIDYIKFKRPGYVIEDLRIILILGVGEFFGVNVSYDIEVLQEWTYQYGIKYISKEQLMSKRNQYLGEASKMISNQKKFGNHNIVAVSLHKLREKYGDDYIKENFPNTYSLSKGLISIGKDVNAPVTWENDPGK